MSELEKFALNDEELDTIAGGTYPSAVWSTFSLDEVFAAQKDSKLCRIAEKPCKMDDDYVWGEAELKELYESRGLVFPGMDKTGI